MKGSSWAKWIRGSMGTERRSWELITSFLWSQKRKAEGGKRFTLYSTQLTGQKPALSRQHDQGYQVQPPLSPPLLLRTWRAGAWRGGPPHSMSGGFCSLQELEWDLSALASPWWVSAEMEGRERQDGQEVGVGVGKSPFIFPPGVSESPRSLPSKRFFWLRPTAQFWNLPNILFTLSSYNIRLGFSLFIIKKTK